MGEKDQSRSSPIFELMSFLLRKLVSLRLHQISYGPNGLKVKEIEIRNAHVLDWL